MTSTLAVTEHNPFQVIEPNMSNQPFGTPAPGSNPYQPVGGGGLPPGEKPKNWLVQSILVTLCCCLPLGIVGIVFAAQVDGKWNSGDRLGAVESARKAKMFTLIGLGLGLVLNLIVFGIQILAVVGGAAAQQQNMGVPPGGF